MKSAYPFYAHAAFDPIKAISPDALKEVFVDPGFRDRFPQDFRPPKPGTVFQRNWDRIVVAAPALPKNAGLMNRNIADIARERGRDALDAFLDLRLEEDVETRFIGRFFNAPDEGVAPLLKHRPASSRCRMPAPV